MSVYAWYQHKAEQCLRLAREATDAAILDGTKKKHDSGAA